MLPGAAGPVAVRADRCRLGSDGATATGLPGVVEAVEYQGGTVRIALKLDGGEPASVLLPDREFEAEPVRPGLRVNLLWVAGDEGRLAA